MKQFNWHKIVFLSLAGLLVFTANAWAEKTKADYDKQVMENATQQQTIHDVMGFVLSHNYYNFPLAVTYVSKVLDELNLAKDAENKAIGAAEKADWQNAISHTNQWQQSQDKAAEIALRTKAYLKQLGAIQVVSTVTSPMTAKVEPGTQDTEGAMLYKSKACLTCHGVDAKTPIMPNYPQLVGQNQAYTVAQMKDIKSGARDNGVSLAMKGTIQTVTDAEMEHIGEWLASLSISINGDMPMDMAGAKLYQSKGCLACHGADANTPIMPNYPKLAGLNEDYVIAQMTDIKSGARHNGQSAAMMGIMLNVSDADIEAIAQWLASLAEKKSVEPEVETVAVTTIKPLAEPEVETVAVTTIEPETAYPATAPSSEAAMPAAPDTGATLFQSKVCFSCHGVDAKTPIMPNYPQLVGQNQAYVVAQMKDIKSGARDNGMTMIMKGTIQTVTDAEMEHIGEWLASLSISINGDMRMDMAGAKLYQSKICFSCHGADANTPIMPSYPKLAGLNEDYVIAQMTDIKSGARHNGQSAAMKGIMLNVSDAEIEAIAQWLASLSDNGA